MSVVQPSDPASSGSEERWLHQRGRVLSVVDGTAQVAVPRTPACGGCAARSGCATGHLACLAGGADAVLSMPARAGLRPGDLVTVSTPAGPFLRAAALAFLLPVVALVGALGLGNALAWPSVLTGAIALLGFAVAFLPLWWAERRGALAGALRFVPSPEGPRDK